MSTEKPTIIQERMGTAGLYAVVAGVFTGSAIALIPALTEDYSQTGHLRVAMCILVGSQVVGAVLGLVGRRTWKGKVALALAISGLVFDIMARYGP